MTNASNSNMTVTLDLTKASQLKKILQIESFYDKSRKCKINTDKTTLAIPVTSNFYKSLDVSQKTVNEKVVEWRGFTITLTDDYLQENIKRTLCKPLKICEQNLKDKNLWFEELKRDLPKSFEKYEDVLLVPHKSLNHVFWNDIDHLKVLAESFKCSRIARKGPISNDKFRTPQVKMILGNDGLVQHTDNKIIYRYDILKCMYSPGNITEKIRISRMDCSNEVVVDLYAGIGYFTLPFLIHGNASLVYACEWNPDAVVALKGNLLLNGVENRCVVLQGDNKEMCPSNVADRVNLGLIPSSKDGWKIACSALKKHKLGILHIHENVNDEKINKNCLDNKGNDCFENNKSADNPTQTANLVKKNNYMKIEITNSKNLKKVWVEWANEVCQEIENILENLYRDVTWRCQVMHIGQVKSYAPHVDHMVVDIQCRPTPI